MGLDRLQGSISIKGDKNALGLINRVNNMKELYSSLWNTASKEIANNELIVNLYEAVLKLYDQAEFTKLDDGEYYITFEMITKKKFAYYVNPYNPNQDEYEVYGYNIVPFILLLKDSHADKRLDYRECDEITHKIINQKTVAKNNGKISANISNMIYDMTKFCVEELHNFITIENKDKFIEDYVRIFVDGNLSDKVNNKKKERKKEEIKTYISKFKKGDTIEKSLIDSNALLCDNCGSAVHIVSMYNDKRRVLRCERCRFDAEIYDKMEDSTVMLLSTAANSDTRCERMVAHKIMELLKVNGVIESEAEIYAGVKNRIYTAQTKVEDVHIGNMQKKELDKLIEYLLELIHKNKSKINTRVALSKTAQSWIKRNLGRKGLRDITVYEKYLAKGMLKSQGNSSEDTDDSCELIEEVINSNEEAGNSLEDNNDEALEYYKDAEHRKEFRKRRVAELNELITTGIVECAKKGKRITFDNALDAAVHKIKKSNPKDTDVDKDSKVTDTTDDKDSEVTNTDDNSEETEIKDVTNITVDMINKLIDARLAGFQQEITGIKKDISELKQDINSVNRSVSEFNHMIRLDKSIQNKVNKLNEKYDGLAKRVHSIIDFSDKEMINNVSKNTDFSKKLLSNLISGK